MTFNRIHDALLAGLVAAAVLAAVFIFGDALYIGAWYYLTVPLVAYSVGASFRPPPLFQFGVSLGIAITFIGFLSVNWRASWPDGMIVLYHLFALPGAAAGLCMAAGKLRWLPPGKPIHAFFYGLLGALGGFLVLLAAVIAVMLFFGT